MLNDGRQFMIVGDPRPAIVYRGSRTAVKSPTSVIGLTAAIRFVSHANHLESYFQLHCVRCMRAYRKTHTEPHALVMLAMADKWYLGKYVLSEAAKHSKGPKPSYTNFMLCPQCMEK